VTACVVDGETDVVGATVELGAASGALVVRCVPDEHAARSKAAIGTNARRCRLAAVLELVAFTVANPMCRSPDPQGRDWMVAGVPVTA
jgi:hypothetical protein